MRAGAGLAVLLTAAGLYADNGLVEGRADSPVRVLIFEDLQCSDCADFRVMLDQRILPRYGARVAFLHRDFPLAKHALARRAAIAARFFSERDAAVGIEYRRQTLASVAGNTEEKFLAALSAFARAHGIEPAAAASSLSDSRLAALVDKDYQEGVARGVARTPTVFVNGRPFIETFTFEEISKGIDEALAQAH